MDLIHELLRLYVLYVISLIYFGERWTSLS
jgi:hypothetical protein